VAYRQEDVVLRRVIAVAAAAAVATLGAGCAAKQIPAVVAAQASRQAAQAAKHKAQIAERAAERAGLASDGRPPVVRLGLVAGMADVSGMVGVQMGYFRGELGQGIRLDAVTFGSDAQEAAALASGQLNAAYLDPVTAVKLWQSSGESLIRIVAGAASGGAELVAGKSITQASQLAGKAVAVPAGGAQAAALGSWLRQQGVRDVSAGAAAVSGAAAVRAFETGQVAAAWEMAPFDAEMTAAGGHVLVSEPAGAGSGDQFASAELVVTQRMLTADPAMVSGLLKGQLLADELITLNKPAAEAVAANGLAAELGQRLPSDIMVYSFAQVSATSDPLESSVLAQARQAAALGLIKPLGSLAGLYDLKPLDTLMQTVARTAQLPAMSG
jgi:NitT/TauT family transport system substrate-binding protein